MGQEASARLIRAFIDAFNQSDWSAMARLVDEEVVFDTGEGERLIGREAFHTFFVTRSRYFRERMADAEIFTGQNDTRGAAEVTLRGEYLETVSGLPEARGQSYALSAGLFFDIDAGCFSRVSLAYDRPALAALLSSG
ncbi:nuclear transport factor 2 family protein [Consotaella salsifontis]|uniref:SnoaL-like domain-containing protein n=1 Tax=Consotaella salsifontis TaxID=1365950 RepID=A0A1T4PQV3_9HYPH|nr:nuclear transport factor 2 family protein [Consotaella salsifontis]SJZ94014.1 conserved hypothetical protein, steroid delta-isomerase-related [Consotaella salsifontis]